MTNDGYACIGLDNPKNSNNVGHALRAAGAYRAKLIAASGIRYKNSNTDTRNEQLNTPFLQVADIFDAVPYDCVPIAVELVTDAISLVDYVHPIRGFYVFGAEDATLGKRVLSKCRDIIYIPTKGCMNLSATVNVVLYDRLVKLGR